MTITVKALNIETGAEIEVATVETMAEAWSLYTALSANNVVRFEATGRDA